MKSFTRFFWIGILTLGAILLQGDFIYAVTADPNPVSYTQPDGSKLTIIIQGDEFIHWAVTSDGYTIMTNSKGTYEYATLDKSGRLIFSGIQANDPAKRNQTEASWLSKREKGLFFSALQIAEFKDHLNKGGVPSAPLMGAFPSTGTRKLLMILVNFNNTTTTFNQDNFSNYMNQVNYNGTGSFRDFYLEVSYGQLTINTTVTVWVTLPNAHDYYGPSTKWGQFAYDAIVAASNQASVNFADYDNNLDGIVDGISIIHQGQGQEETGNANDIWSHSWDLASAGYTFDQRTFNGVRVNAYTTIPERNATGMGTIGVICHEFCHNLGSPDFYDTDYANGGSYTGTGKWDLMAGGSWNGVSGSKPAHPNAWIKASLGWTTPVELSTVQNVTLRNAQIYPDVIRYNTTTPNEYFLCENRQQTGFDAGIPGHGMIIYHVDENYISTHTNTNNINASCHQGLYPVCANATGNPTTMYGTINANGCSFPGTGNKSSFNDVTTPHSHSLSGANTNFPISNIIEYSQTQEVAFCFMGCYTPDDPTGFTAAPLSSAVINLSWGLNTGSSPVLIAFSTTPVFGVPVAGTNYTAGCSVPGGGTVVFNGTGTNFSQSGLNSNTIYYYKAWSIMTGLNYSPGVNTHASTFCGTVNTFPWNEGFENSGFLANCWSQEQVSSSGLNWIFSNGNGVNNPAIAHGGLYNACLKDKTVADSKTRLITPTLDLTYTTNPELSFWHTQQVWSTDQDRLCVYYKTSVTGSWTLLATYTGNIPSWTQETISLPNPGPTYYIAFEGNAKFGYGVCIDDVQVANGCSSYVPVGVSIAASMNPVCAGTTITFTATAVNGGSAPAYQWKLNGTDICGGTNATYSFIPSNGNAVTCVLISNVACATGNPATSNSVVMNLNPSLSVGSIGTDQSVCANSTPLQLTGTAPGNGTNPTYQWQSSLNNLTFNNISGATSINYQPDAGSSTTYYRLMQNATGTCDGSLPTNTVTVTVNPILPVNVTIDASVNPAFEGTPVTFSANGLNGGTTPSYLWEVNGTSVTDANTSTFSYTPSDSDVVTCILISNSTCVVNNPAVSNPVIMSVTNIPAVNVLHDLSIDNSQCFDATQTITVAGGGTSFIVHNGASATMIAGQKINFLPGTVVKPGGYLHGYITTDNQYCPGHTPSAPKIAAVTESGNISPEQPILKVYPNPTEGKFTLELSEANENEHTAIEIYSMTGEKVISTELTGEMIHELSLSDRPNGVYLLRLSTGKNSETARIIKR